MSNDKEYRTAEIETASRTFTLKGGAKAIEREFERMSNAAAAGHYSGTPGQWLFRLQQEESR